jgi:putative transcriptional regulator
MNARSSLSPLFMAACAAIIACSSPARAADISGSIILVAKRHVQDKLYGSTILLVRPIGADRHVGFIVNKPTQMTLGKLFPQHEPSRKVPDPVFLGGPVSPEVIFALVQARESPGGRSIRILDDLYLAIDSHVVDHVIEKQPSQARFLAGMVLWRPGELREELRGGLWYVQDATADIILRKPTDTMWEELVGRSERKANAT